MPIPPGFHVHYSAPGAGGGYLVGSSAAQSYGGYLSVTPIPTGTDLTSMFYAYRRFARAGDYVDRGYARCLFAVNNLGYEVVATSGGAVITGDQGGLSNGPLFAMSFGWDAIEASPWASASPQADTWQPGPWTAAQQLAGDGPEGAGDISIRIPQGYCRGLWVIIRTGSGFFPASQTTKAVAATISVATVPYVPPPH